MQRDDHRVIWKVKLQNDRDVFMSAIVGRRRETSVVHVDAEKFYRLWLSVSKVGALRRYYDCPLREEMPKDGKFHKADRSFDQSRDCPVPLADVGFVSFVDADPTVRLSNGFTRTFWLLVNRAPSFPIRTISEDTAELLNREVGIGVKPLLYPDLFPNMQFDD